MASGCTGARRETASPPAAPSLPPTSTGSAGSDATDDGARGLEAGHSATVDCLHGERAQTDGNELRCEDWSYVRQNYLQAR